MQTKNKRLFSFFISRKQFKIIREEASELNISVAEQLRRIIEVGLKVSKESQLRPKK